MIAIGEETGALGEMLDEVADFYEREVDYDLENLSAAIEPILIVCVGAHGDRARARRVPAALGHGRGRRRACAEPCIRAHVRGFSLLELVVVVAAVAHAHRRRARSLVAARRPSAARRVPPGPARAARARCCSRRPSASRAATRRRIPELAAANPMALLLEPPANYVGDVAARRRADVPRASWYYDEQARPARLSRRPPHAFRRAGRAAPIASSCASRSSIEDRDGDGVFDAAGDRFDGLRLDAGACLRLAGLMHRAVDVISSPR